MLTERPIPLDPQTLRLFADKGLQLLTYQSLAPGSDVLQLGKINAVKVRRVMQLLRDFARQPLSRMRIFDFGCAEGVYAIEAALRGARVHAFDARRQRMDEGSRAAERLKLDNLSFEQADVRDITAGTHGTADAVLLLGILYHLGTEDFFRVLANVHELCQQFVIIETRIALEARQSIKHDGFEYHGVLVREHRDGDSDENRKRRLLASIDNSHSFWPTRESLLAALHHVGFTSVCECHVPGYPATPPDRVTLIAAKGEPVRLSSYPWLNDMSEAEIAQYLAGYAEEIRRMAQTAAIEADRPGE